MNVKTRRRWWWGSTVYQYLWLLLLLYQSNSIAPISYCTVADPAGQETRRRPWQLCVQPETRWKDQRVRGKAELNIDWDIIRHSYQEWRKEKQQTDGRSLEREGLVGRGRKCLY
jgi:hypothetical protein